MSGVALLQEARAGVLDAVATADEQLVSYRRTHDEPWSEPSVVASGVTGQPGIAHDPAADAADLDVVVPLSRGGLAHYRRSQLVWSVASTFGRGRVYGSAALALGLGTPVRLQLVARSGDELWGFSQGEDGSWSVGRGSPPRRRRSSRRVRPRCSPTRARRSCSCRSRVASRTTRARARRWHWHWHWRGTSSACSTR